MFVAVVLVLGVVGCFSSDRDSSCRFFNAMKQPMCTHCVCLHPYVVATWLRGTIKRFPKQKVNASCWKGGSYMSQRVSKGCRALPQWRTRTLPIKIWFPSAHSIRPDSSAMVPESSRSWFVRKRNEARHWSTQRVNFWLRSKQTLSQNPALYHGGIASLESFQKSIGRLDAKVLDARFGSRVRLVRGWRYGYAPHV